ncbi:MAG: hypothetical protein GX287_07680 [Fusobacteria bacterium]|nr:hypothetical protein [Fusobacteriota bacterium]
MIIKRLYFLVFLFYLLIGCNGNFYKHATGEWINKATGKPFDKEGFNKNKFNKAGMHKVTNTKYNEKGYDIFGYDKLGFNKNGYNKLGFHKNGIHEITKSIYDEAGYDINGYDKKGYDIAGFNMENRDKITNGYYNEAGYDYRGYNEEKKHISTNDLYDDTGYDYNGEFNLNSYLNEKEINYFKLSKELEEIKTMRCPEKEQFETTDEYNKRKKELLYESYRKEKELTSRLFILNLNIDTDKDREIKYDADKGVWKIEISNLYLLGEEKYNRWKGKNINSFGVQVESKYSEINREELHFADETTQNKYTYKTFEVEMDINKAKTYNNFKLQILYNINDNLDYILQYDTKYTEFRYSEEVYMKRYYTIYIKYVGIILWDNDLNKILYYNID